MHSALFIRGKQVRSLVLHALVAMLWSFCSELYSMHVPTKPYNWLPQIRPPAKSYEVIKLLFLHILRYHGTPSLIPVGKAV